MEEKILVQGEPKKNSIAKVLIIAGITLAFVSAIVAYCVYDNVEAFKNFGYGVTGWFPYDVLYDFDFLKFFSAQFFDFSCFYGYLLLLAIAAIIAGVVIKSSTENCEITITDHRIYGKLSQGEDISILPNQVLNIHANMFDGITINTRDGVKSFYCFENHTEIVNAASTLLSKPQQSNEINNDAQQLKQLKELLDANIISQEEFDEKKKRILGL